MRTFVCIVSETGRRVTTENGESLQRRERLCAGRSIRLFQRTRAKQAYVKGDLEGIMRGQHYCTCAFRRRQLSPFYPLSTLRHHVRYFGAQALRYPKPRGSKVARNNRSSRGPENEAKCWHHPSSAVHAFDTPTVRLHVITWHKFLRYTHV